MIRPLVWFRTVYDQTRFPGHGKPIIGTNGATVVITLPQPPVVVIQGDNIVSVTL